MIPETHTALHATPQLSPVQTNQKLEFLNYVVNMSPYSDTLNMCYMSHQFGELKDEVNQRNLMFQFLAI